jgi:hypothetical protein
MKQVVKTSEFTLNKAATSVRGFMSREPFIHGIYLINFNIDQIYTSESSIYTTRDFYDQSMLNYIKGQKTPLLEQRFQQLASFYLHFSSLSLLHPSSIAWIRINRFAPFSMG